MNTVAGDWLNRLRTWFPDRELIMRSQGQVRFIKITGRVQMLVAGAVVLEGSLLPPVPTRIRVTMGLVVLLMGLYRIVITRTRAQQLS